MCVGSFGFNKWSRMVEPEESNLLDKLSALSDKFSEVVFA